ncbi:MFS transporter [Terrarubrum flagellatum]|uniref:MFS transporter n=1 Tax=Terrirubrum flagellatum TaxID=2895980 RepID=UPI0031454371
MAQSAEAQPNRWPSEADFWRLWLVGAVQFSVRWIEMLAIGIFVYQSTGSPFLVTLLTMLRVLPLALFGAFVGAAADLVEGRAVLLLNTLTLLATSVTMAFLAYAGRLEIWHLAIATFTSGVIWSTDMPLRRLMIGRVVGPDRMANAMVFDVGSSNASRMAGPAIGGAALAAWGINGCFALGAVMYLLAILAAAGIRYRNPHKPNNSSLRLRNILDAVALVRSDKRLLGVFAITFIFNLFAWPNLSLIPVIGKDNLHLGPTGVGLLASMEGVGAITGVLVVYFFGRPAYYPKLYIYSVLAYLVALTTFAMLPDPSLAGVALFMAGLGGSGFAITQSTLAFRSATPEMRGRILGLLSVSIGIGPLGFLQVGLLANAFGAPLATIITGCEGLVALLLTQRFWREIRMRSD